MPARYLSVFEPWHVIPSPFFRIKMFLWNNTSCSYCSFRLSSNKAFFPSQHAAYLGLLLCTYSSTSTFLKRVDNKNIPRELQTIHLSIRASVGPRISSRRLQSSNPKCICSFSNVRLLRHPSDAPCSSFGLCLWARSFTSEGPPLSWISTLLALRLQTFDFLLPFLRLR